MSVQWTGSAAGPADGESAAAAQTSIWTVPEMGALPQDAHGRLVRRGRDLITATYAYVGPELPDAADRYAGDNLACGNCHLQREQRSSEFRCSDCSENTLATTRAPVPGSRWRSA